MNFKTPTLPFYFLIIGVFLIIISPHLLSHGMFMDGLIYSTIAKNMSAGLGSFWHPYYTATYAPDFHGHPPLAFGIQSLFYSAFGDSRFVDKLYSILTFAIVGFIMLKIWKIFHYKNAWVPLFLWLMTPAIIWASCNNLLENTLTIFTSLSIFFYFKSQSAKKYFFLFLAGLMLSLGFLTKGPVAFFPWTLPFLTWLVLKEKTTFNMLIESTTMLLCTIVPLILLMLLFPQAKLSLQQYIQTELMHGILNVKTVDSRFFIIKRLISELIPAIGVCMILLFFMRLKKFDIHISKATYKHAVLFILLGLTGVLPVIITMKQSGFYIQATYPCFAIGIAIFINPFIDFLLKDLKYESTKFFTFKWIGYGVFTVGVLLSLYHISHFSREERKLKDIYLIIPEIPAHSIINIHPKMWDDWSLYGYFERYKNISLDVDLAHKREYLLIQNEYYSDTLKNSYKIILLPTINYKLCKKIS